MIKNNQFCSIALYTHLVTLFKSYVFAQVFIYLFFTYSISLSWTWDTCFSRDNLWCVFHFLQLYAEAFRGFLLLLLQQQSCKKLFNTRLITMYAGCAFCRQKTHHSILSSFPFHQHVIIYSCVSLVTHILLLNLASSFSCCFFSKAHSSSIQVFYFMLSKQLLAL